eukprot:CCRYP_006670-RA/>CCRYP_006670-RA protein AED:0.38 eAED:0.38 QI:0/0/0/1/0/0/2/0/71
MMSIGKGAVMNFLTKQKLNVNELRRERIGGHQQCTAFDIVMQIFHQSTGGNRTSSIKTTNLRYSSPRTEYG